MFTQRFVMISGNVHAALSALTFLSLPERSLVSHYCKSMPVSSFLFVVCKPNASKLLRACQLSAGKGIQQLAQFSNCRGFSE